MTPRPPIPPLTPPGSLFSSGRRAAPARAAVEGAGGATRPAPPAVPGTAPGLGAPPSLGAPHREAWRQLRAHGPYTLQHPAAGWTCWLPEDKARPALGIAGAVMDVLAAAGHAAIDATPPCPTGGRATATARPFPAHREETP